MSMEVLKKYSITILVFSLVNVFFSCIEEVALFTGNSEALIIDGMITNKPGRHKVKVSQTQAYNTFQNPDLYMTAEVTIVDDQGNVESLSYTSLGVFETSPDFFAVEGRSYAVNVKLPSGEEFYSTPETFVQPPPISNVRYTRENNQVHYYVNFTDTEGEPNYYRWRYKGTYQVFAPIAYQLSRTNQPLRNSDCIRWSGLPPLAKDVVNCWVIEYDKEFLKVDSDILFDGRELKDYKIFETELNTRFEKGYLVEIELHSLSKDAYKFWEEIQTQKENTGTIFDADNYQIRGNVKSRSNEQQVVLGYFSVNGVSSTTVFVNEFIGLFGEVPCPENNSGCYPERCMDCRRFAAEALNIKPSYWPY